MPIIANGPPNAASTSLPTPAATSAAPGGRSASNAGKDDGFSFGDLLDIINPLQHIPVVGALYREITGDTIGAAAKVAGGALFGGVIGLVASLVDSVISETTGKDGGQHLVAMLRSGDADYGPDSTGGTDVALLDNAAPADGRDSRADGEQIAARDDASDAGAARDGEDIWPGEAADGDTVFTQPQAGRVRTAANMSAQPLDNPRHSAEETRALGNLYQSHNATRPQALQTSVPLTGVRGAAFAGLPAPQTVAANPGLIAGARGGAKAGGGSNAIEAGSAGWIKLMQAAEGSRSNATGGLASATIAKAMASYGALGGAKNPMASLAGASRR